MKKYGSLINSSFFDASNILGTLKLKGLIDFSTVNFSGQNAIMVTDTGKQLLAEADSKAATAFDELDFAIVSQLSASKRSFVELAGMVNLRPKDMALHINKLVVQQYVSYAIRNGNLDIMLTEKGFLQAKAGMLKPEPAMAQPTADSNMAGQQPGTGMQMPRQGPLAEAMANAEQMAPGAEDQMIEAKRKPNSKLLIAVAIVVIIVIALFVLRQYGVLPF